MVMSAYGVPQSSTLQFGDLYNGAPSYAAPAQVATNPGGAGATVSQATEQKGTASQVPSVTPSGLELPALVALFVAALVLVRYY